MGGQGQGNATIELPGMGQRERGGGSGSAQGEGQYGDEHVRDSTLDTPTTLDANGTVTRIDGEHGEGATRSQVILGAADRGFASRGYRRVFTDYSGHAEEALEQDEIPQGYRFYVRRYFQLIRPRDEGTP